MNEDKRAVHAEKYLLNTIERCVNCRFAIYYFANRGSGLFCMLPMMEKNETVNTQKHLNEISRDAFACMEFKRADSISQLKIFQSLEMLSVVKILENDNGLLHAYVDITTVFHQFPELTYKDAKGRTAIDHLVNDSRVKKITLGSKQLFKISDVEDYCEIQKADSAERLLLNDIHQSKICLNCEHRKTFEGKNYCAVFEFDDIDLYGSACDNFQAI